MTSRSGKLALHAAIVGQFTNSLTHSLRSDTITAFSVNICEHSASLTSSHVYSITNITCVILAILNLMYIYARIFLDRLTPRVPSLSSQSVAGLGILNNVYMLIELICYGRVVCISNEMSSRFMPLSIKKVFFMHIAICLRPKSHKQFRNLQCKQSSSFLSVTCETTS